MAQIDISGFAMAIGVLVLAGCTLVGGWVIGLGAATAIRVVWRAKLDIQDEIDLEFRHRIGGIK
jgi:hypothetical protein